RRTRATLRSAEFGFFGVVVYTRVHTPRRIGRESSAGEPTRFAFGVRPLRTSCCIVGKLISVYSHLHSNGSIPRYTAAIRKKAWSFFDALERLPLDVQKGGICCARSPQPGQSPTATLKQSFPV